MKARYFRAFSSASFSLCNHCALLFVKVLSDIHNATKGRISYRQIPHTKFRYGAPSDDIGWHSDTNGQK
ncbi:hypothetical protein P8452_26547 [Trifolium repens]|nr:hypothetical protein P8452_26547 [Trifolium repens]